MASDREFRHVFARGNNRGDVFFHSQDYIDYLLHLKSLLKSYRVDVVAGCLMQTHIHFLFLCTQEELSLLMMRLHRWFTQRMNWRYGRIGHLFQGPFRSKPVRNAQYLLEVARYIHMNPVVAGVTDRPEEYEWSTFKDYVGLAGPISVNTKVLTGAFNGGSGFDPEEFRRYTVGRVTCGFDYGSIPSDVDWYFEEMKPAESSSEEACQTRAVGRVIAQIARRFGVGPGRLRRAARDPWLGTARAAAMFILRETFAMPLSDIGKEFDVEFPQSVSRAISKFKRRIARDPGLRRMLELPPNAGVR